MAAEKKILVVYYSRADENYTVGNISKGNTEIIAEMIAKKTGGTLLHVEPAKEYPKGYDDCINVAKKELAQDARPAIKPVNVNPEEFDEIYVGYPVWWGEMPMPMFTFFEKYNLKGKTIHPVRDSRRQRPLGCCPPQEGDRRERDSRSRHLRTRGPERT